MLADKTLMKAVAGIKQRSEKQPDIAKLVESFVDVGVLPQLNNSNSQIIFGRRGTGKTHVLSVLGQELRNEVKNTVAFIDARNLGSTSQFTDESISLKTRCISLFRDILGQIYNSLLEHIVERPSPLSRQALEELDRLGSVVTGAVEQANEAQITSRQKNTESNSIDSKIEISKSPSVSMGVGASSAGESEVTVSRKLTSEDKVIFPALTETINSILEKADTDLFVLIDEWASLPLVLQPYLAEFLKRSFLPHPRITVKIAALEYRSQFGVRKERGSVLGFELGSDLAVSLDLDDYYVFDRNPGQVTAVFASLLQKHVTSELPTDSHLLTTLADGDGFVRALFTSRNTFEELVRASEGVARDLINIFLHSYFAAQRKGQDKIDKKTIVEAARKWFEEDKQQNLDDDLRLVLQRIVTEVIGRRKARSFLIPRELEKNHTIQALFDARVLHLMRRGYADKENPGVRFSIYTLDYGTYVDLLNTSNAPAVELQDKPSEDSDFVVPFDDKRSIRRIVLRGDVLNLEAPASRTLPFPNNA
jgi:hypothetical protein